jgi:hypothetical protein
MTLEQAIAYIQDDELVGVTPRAIRIRKRYLDPHERKRQSRKGGVIAGARAAGMTEMGRSWRAVRKTRSISMDSKSLESHFAPVGSE